MKQNFEKAGGKLWEFAAAEGADIYSDGCAINIPGKDGKDNQCLTGRLLIDCMGNASPIVRQVSNFGSLTSPCSMLGRKGGHFLRGRQIVI